MAFDIPAQPLEQAIHSFAEESGVQVLYETALTSGRRSAAIKGRLTAKAALQSLLRGSRLRATETTPEAFTLLSDEAVSVPAEGITKRRLDLQKHGAFLGAAQASILDVLCRSALTRPGKYGMSLLIWIDPSGTVAAATVTKSTGEAKRDAAITESLRGLALLAPPPADLPQPLGMVIAPLDPKESGDCLAADTARPFPPSGMPDTP